MRNKLLGNWNNDVYTGRQWNDYLTPKKVASSIVQTEGVLLLYSPECMDKIQEISDWKRPPLQYLCYAKHDCETTPQHIWYYLDEKDRLCERYNYKEQIKCGSFLYFKKGSDINTPTEVFYTTDFDDIVEWMWEKVMVKLSVKNTRKEPITVHISGRGPKISTRTVDPEETLQLTGYQSYALLIQTEETSQFLYGTTLENEDKNRIIVIDHETKMDEASSRKWFKKRDNEIQKESRYMREWRWGVAEIYLLDFKQSPLLPKFTELGYKKGTMPQDMYAKIMHWYRENTHRREPEESSVEPAINDSEVKCALVFFTPDMIEYIGEVMKPYLEEWSNMTLVQTRLYGIREYYHGNILRNHVDRITTHIISVILQIDKELDGGADWELEIIGFDGYRKNVTLQPGEMLFYESSTLIHGRPFPFQGRMFANAFLHYKPADNWPWHISPDGSYLMKSGKIVEPTRAFSTENTYKLGPMWRNKDEL